MTTTVHTPGSLDGREVCPRRLLWAALPVVALSLLVLEPRTSAASPTEVKCGNSDPDCLWKIVQGCGTTSPGQCAYVDAQRKFAILKAPKGSTHYLVIPTTKVTGIEDSAVKEPGFRNYWAYAWEAATGYVKRPREWMGLAINSVEGRRQNQMHIHIACVRSNVKANLETHSAEIKATWAARPFLDLAGQKYNAMKIGGSALASESPPFQLLLKLAPAAHHMGDQTLAVIGTTDGFVILDDYADGKTDPGHAEGLLDEDCSGAPRGHQQ
jgi:CDP-diacylglycerol pyrophosphatase